MKSSNRVRKILIYSTAVFGILLAGLFSLYIWLDLQRTEREVQARLLDEAFAFSENIESTLRSAHIALVSIRSLIEAKGGLSGLDETSLYALFGHQLQTLSRDVEGIPKHALFAVDRDGLVKSSSVGFPIERVDASERGYYQHFRDHPDDGVRLSPLRRSLATNLNVVFLTLAVRDQQGGFDGVLGVSLRSKYFETFYQQQQLKQGQATTLFRHDGKPFFRHPMTEGFIDVDIAELPVFKTIRRVQEGNLRLVSPIDQVDRYLGFYTASQYPLTAIVSQPVISALAPWRANAQKTGALFLAVVVALMMLLWVALHQTANVDAHLMIESALLEANRKLQDMQQMMDRYVIVSDTDLDGNITYASEAFCQISGYSKQELLGQNHRLVRHPRSPERIYRHLWQTVTQGQTWHGELRNQAKDGSEYWVYATIVPIVDSLGRCTGYRSIRQDISDKKLAERLAVTDHLTGLANRAKLDRALQRQQQESERYGSCFSLILIDIDNFKLVNDSFGHQVGDEVLQEVAAVLKSSTRATDLVGRWGGEEFLIVAPFIELTGAQSMAEKLRAAIEQAEYRTVHRQTASFGVSSYRPGDDTEAMLSRADEALYRAKSEGRNRVETQLAL